MARDNHLPETELGRFRHALLDTVYRTYLAAQADFPGHADAAFDARVHIAAQHGGNDGQVDGRIGHFQSSGYVQEHVFLRQFKPHALLQHGQQHIQPAQVEAGGRTLRRAVSRRADQGLRLDEEGAHALDGRRDGDATQSFVILGEQQFRRIAPLPQTVLPHLVDAQLGRAAETVLDAAQDTVHIMLVALELQHGIHDMFQHLGAGQCPLLIDMADQYHGNIALLGEFQQQRGALAHLRDAAGRTVHGLCHDGLYGIYDHQLRLLVTDVQENLVERSLAHDHTRRTGQEPFPSVHLSSCPWHQTVGTQLQLPRTLLSTDIKHPLVRHFQYGLQD